MVNVILPIILLTKLLNLTQKTLLSFDSSDSMILLFTKITIHSPFQNTKEYLYVSKESYTWHRFRVLNVMYLIHSVWQICYDRIY